MSKPYWDLEQPRGRILPAVAAGLVPVLVALVAVGLLLIRPAFRGLDHAQTVLSAATELRSTSRALQRDVLLLIFDEPTREKTDQRLAARLPEFRTAVDGLGAALDPVDPEKARRIRETHAALADGVAAVVASVQAREGIDATWRVQQDRVLAAEIPAARTNDPIIDQYRIFVTASVGEVKTALWLSFLIAFVALGFGIASAAVVLRR
ncbi:hypothetical protein [Niveispirillum sp.]|uniref:hypothetical protein n=1 Tax=Niveispirillum sp. TaxID=1917217 RepID=UPI001B49FD08|nr:hypothetical protein [Niveispirillum sp.]MBP7335438.1 hypothetical protein [Niveispirillum sp.]